MSFISPVLSLPRCSVAVAVMRICVELPHKVTRRVLENMSKDLKAHLEAHRELQKKELKNKRSQEYPKVQFLTFLKRKIEIL